MSEPMTQMIQCMQKGLTDLSKVEMKKPKGLYGRVLNINCGGWFSADLGQFDIECNIPFDDDTEANEAEIVIYNLSVTSIKALEYNAPVTVTAGYETDSTGVIFQGNISQVKTTHTNLDTITTIYAVDNKSLKERDMISKTYSAGTRASVILRDLVNQLNLPVAVFQTIRDHSYPEETTVEGGLMSKIKELAGVCGVKAYINKQAVYVQPLDYAASDWFDITPSTGLISDIDISFEEEEHENYTDKRTVYSFQTLLNHRIVPSCAVNLKSRAVSGQFRVYKGEHVINENDFYTKIYCY